MAGMQSVTVKTVAPRSVVGLAWLAGAEKALLLEHLPYLPQQAQLVLSLFYVEALTASEVAFAMELDVRDVLKCHDAALAVLRTGLHTI